MSGLPRLEILTIRDLRNSEGQEQCLTILLVSVVGGRMMCNLSVVLIYKGGESGEVHRGK